jgi:hypothetical protein
MIARSDVWPLRNHAFALGALGLLMVATRMEHFGGAMYLPDASLAVFALAGLASAGGMVFISLLALATGIDFWAVNVAGVAADCFTPAYPALALAYGVLFAFGRWARGRALSWPVATGMIATLALAFAISNLSFFQFSGLYPDMALGDYVAATWRYAPAYVGYGFCYVLVGVALAGLAQRRSAAPEELRDGA